MPATRGMPEDEAIVPVSERVAGVIAGRGVVRRVVLYAVMAACMGLAYYVPVLVVPALVCEALLLSTDVSL